MAITIKRNVGGVFIPMVYSELDPEKIILDSDNVRIKFPLTQLAVGERTQPAIDLLLHTQEEINILKKSIEETKGVQEPIFVHKGIVIEGNRRVTALRELKKNNPEEKGYQTIPAWVLPDETPDKVIQELKNSAHLDPKRPWAPFERSLELKSLFDSGEAIPNLAARYEMDEGDIKDFIKAAELMINEFVPLLEDPGPECKTKFSYFLEYSKGPRKVNITIFPDLDTRFARWVKNGNIPKAEKVRKLGKILGVTAAVDALEDEGFEAALEVLVDEDPMESPHYKALEKATKTLKKLPHQELIELRVNPEKQLVFRELAQEVDLVMRVVGPFA